MVTIMAGAQRALEPLKPCPGRAALGPPCRGTHRCLSVPGFDGQGALSGQPGVIEAGASNFRVYVPRPAQPVMCEPSPTSLPATLRGQLESTDRTDATRGPRRPKSLVVVTKVRQVALLAVAVYNPELCYHYEVCQYGAIP